MKIVFTERAKRDWQNLDKNIQNKLRQKLSFYLKSSNPLHFSEKLKDYKVGGYRFRIGDFRIIFDVIDSIIFVLKVGHRKDIYK